jgi:UDP-N-acetylmuramate--alanine ligase
MLIVALQHAGWTRRSPSAATWARPAPTRITAAVSFVAEADESDGSLLEYTPDVAVVTNIEADHLDFFGSREAYAEVFDAFVDRIARVARWWCASTTRRGGLAERARPGGSGAAYGAGPAAAGAARLVRLATAGHRRGRRDQLAGEAHPRAMRLAVPGQHMALNALAALLAAVEAGAPVDDVLDGLAGFEGVRRASNWSGPPTGCGSSTTTRITRPRSRRR